MQENLLRSTLSNLPLSEIHYFDNIDSTNLAGLRLLKEGASEYTLLAAENQTAGRGRMDRHWVTTPGASLAFSLIILPHADELQYLPLFTILGGLALCNAIAQYCGVKAKIKWPNDILLNGEKTAGILAESSWEGNKMLGLALGIGVNLLPRSIPFEKPFIFPATCLQKHCKKKILAENFLNIILEHIIQMRPSITKPEFIINYRENLAFLGEMVSLISPGGLVTHGVFLGVNAQGSLMLRRRNGEIEEFSAGDLSLRLT